MFEVVRLQEHVTEFGEREAALKADLDRVLGEHVRHGEMLPGVAQESDEREISQPIEVVDHHRSAGPGREVQEPLQLAAQRNDVRLQRLAVQEVALRRPPGRIADHPGPPTDQSDRSAAVSLKAEQAEDRHQVADVEGVRGGVEAVVAGDRSACREAGGQPRCRVMQDAPPCQFRQQSTRLVRGRVRHRFPRRVVSQH